MNTPAFLSSTMPLVHAEGVTVLRDARPVVSDVALTIRPGQIVGLLGANGSGKTSLIQALLGLIPYTGMVRIHGRDPRRERAAVLRDTAFLADVGVLPRWATLEQLVRLLAQAHPRFNRARALVWLDAAQLPLDKRLRTFSKGMLAQAHLALVLATPAPLLVLDEPTLGLDAAAVQRFYAQLIGDYHDQDNGIVIATHHLGAVAHLLTDLVVMHQGKIAFAGSLEAAQARFVAGRVSASLAREWQGRPGVVVQPSLEGARLVLDTSVATPPEDWFPAPARLEDICDLITGTTHPSMAAEAVC